MSDLYAALPLDEGGAPSAAPPQWQSFNWNPDGSFSIVPVCPAGTTLYTDEYGRAACIPVAALPGGQVTPPTSPAAPETFPILGVLIAFWLLTRL